MRRNKRALAVLGLTGVVITGCSREQKANANTAVREQDAKIETIGDPNVFQVAHPEQFPLVKAEVRKAAGELLVNGVIAPDVSRNVPVQSLSGGRVIEIDARLGDDVTKGQLLLKIQSTDLAAAIADYQKFQADEVLARRALERAKLLYDHGAIAEKDLQQAEDTEQKAKVDVATAAERIRILNGDLQRPSPIIEIRAPVSGTIVEQNITAGAGVKSLDNSPNLFTIADLSHVWLLCDVYENNLAQVHVGDLAEVRLNAYPNLPLRGRVSNISRMLDPTTRTAKVRIDLDNRRGLMRPNMFATARFVSQNTQNRVVVPTSAILRLHDKDWVFRPLGGKMFRRAEVQTGPAGGDGWQQILAGLAPGDEVVANALEFSSVIEQM